MTGVRNHLAEEQRLLVDALTQRQRDILKMIAKDFSQAEIAEAFGISINTLKCHRVALYKALGVATAVGATAVAFRVGLVQ
jgi:DNA-binding NarL/FixJ family response regulator